MVCATILNIFEAQNGLQVTHLTSNQDPTRVSFHNHLGELSFTEVCATNYMTNYTSLTMVCVTLSMIFYPKPLG